jgi:hypothetical protein
MSRSRFGGQFATCVRLGPIGCDTSLGQFLPEAFLVLTHLDPTGGDGVPNPFAGCLSHVAGRPSKFGGQSIGLQAIGGVLHSATNSALNPQR